MSERDFRKQKGEEGEIHRTRSVTFTPSVSVAEPAKPKPMPEIVPSILSASPLNLHAPEFRPRANTLPTQPMSHSLPTNIPSHLERHGDKRQKRSDQGKRHGTARFFPAISKENLHEKVGYKNVCGLF